MCSFPCFSSNIVNEDIACSSAFTIWLRISVDKRHQIPFSPIIASWSCFSMFIAQLTIPSNARWSENAITVAGSWHGEEGSALDLLHVGRGLCITGDDTLYIADTGNARIVVIRPNSTKAVATIESGEIPNPFGGYVDVFVTETNLYVLDSSTDEVKIWGMNRSSPYTVDGNPPNVINIETANNFFVDTDGNVYVSERFTHIVRCFPSNLTNNTDSFIVAGNGTYGSEPSQLYIPSGIFVDDARALYIADYANHRIQKWTYGASFGVTVAGNGACDSSNLIHLCSPILVMVDSNQHIYTLEAYMGRIIRWTMGSASGECIAACSGVYDLQSNHLVDTYAIAFDSQGALYASDTRNNRVQKFQIITDSSKYSQCFDACILPAYVIQSRRHYFHSISTSHEPHTPQEFLTNHQMRVHNRSFFLASEIWSRSDLVQSWFQAEVDSSYGAAKWACCPWKLPYLRAARLCGKSRRRDPARRFRVHSASHCVLLIGQNMTTNGSMVSNIPAASTGKPKG